MINKCVVCNKSFYVRPAHSKIRPCECCSVQCAGKNKIGKPNPKRKRGKNIKCKICDKSFYVKKSHSKTKKYCSKKCFNQSKIELRGSKAGHWKGGQYKNQRGYVFIYSPSHPNCNSRKYVKRANLIMEKHLGRFLIPPELIHHKGKKDDDRIEMLELFPNNSKHLKK